MRWTIWQKRTECQNCGAKIPVPETGLMMTCPYCGTETPVPDIEARRKRAQETSSQEHAKDKHHKHHHDHHKHHHDKKHATGRGHGFFAFLLVMGIIVAALHFSGLDRRVTEPLFGNPGTAAYRVARTRLRIFGRFVRVTRPKTMSVFTPSTPTTLDLDIQTGRPYALVVGGGQPLANVVIRGPRGHRVIGRNTRRYNDALVFTPKISGAYSATVSLTRAGRFHWALFRGPRPPKKDAADALLTARRKRLERRQRAHRKPREKARRKTASHAQRQATAPRPKTSKTRKNSRPRPLPVPRAKASVSKTPDTPSKRPTAAPPHRKSRGDDIPPSFQPDEINPSTGL